MAMRPTTRREALRAAGAAALAAGGVPLLGGRAAASPIANGRPGLRPLTAGIDLTPNGGIQPGSAQDYRVVRGRPWWPELRAAIGWLRVWADWPTLQPDPTRALGDPASPGHAALIALDEQIRFAKDDGLAVLLIPYRYPLWANGTAALAPGALGDLGDLALAPADRTREAAWAARGTGMPTGWKAREFALPLDGHGPGSAWGRFMAALFERYVAPRTDLGPAPAPPRVDAVEVVNEPNLQLWPQRSPSPDPARPFSVEGTELTVHRAVAEMMVTVDGLARAAGGIPCLGPSTADGDSTEPRLVSAVGDGFAGALLDELDRQGFAGGCHWTWSYHNYLDMEQGTGRVSALREQLAGRWRGLQHDGGAAVAATEGGCRLAAFGDGLSHAARLRAQAQRLARSIERHRDPSDLGAGLTLLTQYTATADPDYDCGLREADGGRRPAFDAWRAALA
jgi:hypothetical protein